MNLKIKPLCTGAALNCTPLGKSIEINELVNVVSRLRPGFLRKDITRHLYNGAGETARSYLFTYQVIGVMLFTSYEFVIHKKPDK